MDLSVPGSRTKAPTTSALWIAAHRHRRTIGLCSAWSVPLVLVRPGGRGLIVWLLRVADAIRVLVRRRPELLLVANPSLALSTLAYLLRPVLGYCLVIDAHNEGVRPFDRQGTIVRALTWRLLRSADATIVSNEALALDVRAAGGNPLVLPDRLPAPDGEPDRDHGFARRPLIVVVATFRSDEPIGAIIEAAATLPEADFVLTGDAAHCPVDRAALPGNVRLSGYLADDRYWQQLEDADAVCDLTLKPDCLVCGAYEGLALGKPLVLSEDSSARAIFGPAAVFTRNDPASIAAAFSKVLAGKERYAESADELRQTYERDWVERGAFVWKAISGVAQDRRGGGEP